MRTKRLSVFGSGVGLAVLACSSQPAPPSGTGTEVAPPPQGVQDANVVTYFKGSFDAATGSLTIAYRDGATGKLRTEAAPTLPYGGSASTGAAAGDVLFHTCSQSYTPSGGGGTLSGSVQAVNNTGSTIGGMTIVVDSISDPGTTFNTNLASNSYGTVPSTNNFGCGSNLGTWSFVQSSTTNFTFIGHATGIVGSFTVGGTVSGLTGTGLVLQNNGGDDLTINADGTFHFATGLASGAPYSVAVHAYPSSGQICSVTSGASGNIAAANVTDVAVSCFTAPTGGTITTVGGNRIHKFTSSGTFQTFGPMSVSYLIVAGGGGGGCGDGAGGGGGGVLTGTVPLATSTFPVVVGAAGTGASCTSPNDVANPVATHGANSSFDAQTAVGGGFGGSEDNTGGGGPKNAGGTGGSGGGAGGCNDGVLPTIATGTAGQGTSGGQRSPIGVACGMGGGGGAGAVGGNGNNSNVGGTGGAGISSSISGASTFYGGGGSGSTRGGVGPAGGQGGGGAGGSNCCGNHSGSAGTANTGGGGGGGGDQSTVGGAGGSGVVIVSYPML